MSWFPTWEGILVAVGVAVAVRAVLVASKYDDNRLRRIFEWPLPGATLGRKEYFWSGTAGSNRAEVERALSPEHARRFGWLMTPPTRMAIVVLNVVSWALAIYGGFDLPLGLGLADSHLSWWGIACIPAWWLARTSARVIADAPEELLDERLLAIRNDSYYEAYRLIGMVVSAIGAVAIAVDAFASSGRSLEIDASDWTSLIVTLPFVSIWAFSSLPSLVLISRRAID